MEAKKLESATQNIKALVIKSLSFFLEAESKGKIHFFSTVPTGCIID